MAKKILQAFAFIVLLSVPTLGRSYLDGDATDIENDPTTQLSSSTGPPGKRGPAGARGEPGPPGVQGPPGNPGAVDYDRLSKMFDEKNRQGSQKVDSRLDDVYRNITGFRARMQRVDSRLDDLDGNMTKTQTGLLLLLLATRVFRNKLQEVDSRFDDVNRNITDLQASMQDVESRVSNLRIGNTQAGQSCKRDDGFPYNGRCYFVRLSSSYDLTYHAASVKCSYGGGRLAEFHSLAHQQALMNFLRAKIPPAYSYVYLWTGMTYSSRSNSLRFRSGKSISASRFKWYSGYPSGSYSNLVVTVGYSYEGLWNYYANYYTRGVICEKSIA